MSDRHILRQVIGITLSFVLLGLLSVTAYAAGPAPEDAYQAIPAANHCPGITNDAAGSIFLAANPELSAACRYATILLQQRATASTLFPNLASPDTASSLDKVEQLQTVESERGKAMPESIFAAANPEAMRARYYTAIVSGLVQLVER